ncbi:39S ribosomal protein L32, mitochondrial-like [Homalodisca vitripennis]|uniref:39S ribosomal protein L32, mitochondrial-like n=1 Tax=Homalodisca vitripennis TaxID=197043 RepID=UPI001EEA7042|nr:39S ribosomal protein L32, mitochondrial-like [Homalodisca vitripennis]
MLRSVVSQIVKSLIKFENIVLSFETRQPSDTCYALCIENSIPGKESRAVSSLLEDWCLWAVPKHRITVEKRQQRKFGWPTHVWKPIVPKKNLVTCRSCGDHHVSGHLCPTCYSKNKKETEQIQAAIVARLGLQPIDTEVVVLYQGEREGVTDEFSQGKRIIEMKKERPAWFCRNLSERTTQASASTTSVRRSDLA